MAAHKPVEWVQAVVNRFDEQVAGAAEGEGRRRRGYRDRDRRGRCGEGRAGAGRCRR